MPLDRKSEFAALRHTAPVKPAVLGPRRDIVEDNGICSGDVAAGGLLEVNIGDHILVVTARGVGVVDVEGAGLNHFKDLDWGHGAIVCRRSGGAWVCDDWVDRGRLGGNNEAWLSGMNGDRSRGAGWLSGIDRGRSGRVGWLSGIWRCRLGGIGGLGGMRNDGSGDRG